MNNWDILGISPTTDKKEIRRAYAKMLAKYHPEEHPDKFEEINAAYQWALKYDPNVANLYDFIDDITLITLDDIFSNYAEGPYADEYNNELPEELAAKIADIWPYIGGESIFTSDEELEATTEEMQIADKALEDFKFTLNTAVGTIFQDKNGKKVLAAYVQGETFNSVKRNPHFIDGITSLLPTIAFTSKQVKILKNALGINSGWDTTRYQGHIAIALARLEAQLNAKIFDNAQIDTKASRHVRRIVNILLITAVIFAVIYYLGFWQPSHTGAGIADGIIDTTTTTEARSFPVATTIEAQLNATQTIEEFMTYVVPNPEIVDAWRESISYDLIQWLYQTTGRETFLITPTFPFLYGEMQMPQVIFYGHYGEIGFHIVHLNVVFGCDVSVTPHP